jgi:hypothetical protein
MAEKRKADTLGFPLQLYRQSFAGNIFREPGLAAAAETGRERELGMIAAQTRRTTTRRYRRNSRNSIRASAWSVRAPPRAVSARLRHSADHPSSPRAPARRSAASSLSKSRRSGLPARRHTK